MPQQEFALEPNGPKRIKLSWGFAMKNFTVTFDGAPLGAATSAELKAGKTMPLPDGTNLFVCFRPGLGSAGVEVTRDGKALPGSSTDAATQVKTASQVLYFIGGLTAVVSAAGLFVQNDVLNRLGGGVGGIIEGVLFVLLAWFASRRSLVALVIGTVLYLAESIYGLVSAGASTGIIVRVIFAVVLVRGIMAALELKRAAATTPTPDAPNPG